MQEEHLSTWVLAQEALGVPLTHGQIRQFASRLLQSDRFKHGKNLNAKKVEICLI